MTCKARYTSKKIEGRKREAHSAGSPYGCLSLFFLGPFVRKYGCRYCVFSGLRPSFLRDVRHALESDYVPWAGLPQELYTAETACDQAREIGRLSDWQLPDDVRQRVAIV